MNEPSTLELGQDLLCTGVCLF